LPENDVMLTDDFIKGAFIRKAVNEDLQTIRERQLMIVRDGEYRHGAGGYQASLRKGSLMNEHTGRLISALSGNAYQITGSGAQLQFRSTVPIYIRFLDMKHLGDWRIYNRQIWGILYNNSYQEIRFGFTDEVREFLRKSLDPHHYNVKSKV